MERGRWLTRQGARGAVRSLERMGGEGESLGAALLYRARAGLQILSDRVVDLPVATNAQCKRRFACIEGRVLGSRCVQQAGTRWGTATLARAPPLFPSTRPAPRLRIALTVFGTNVPRLTFPFLQSPGKLVNSLDAILLRIGARPRVRMLGDAALLALIVRLGAMRRCRVWGERSALTDENPIRDGGRGCLGWGGGSVCPWRGRQQLFLQSAGGKAPGLATALGGPKPETSTLVHVP